MTHTNQRDHGTAGYLLILVIFASIAAPAFV